MTPQGILLGVLLLVPLAGLLLLLAVPALDVVWEHHPSHFWLVLAVALLNVILGLAMSETAARRGDRRIFLVSMALLASAGFLGLHALATPQVLLEGPNAGFVIATPVGLILAAGFAAASAQVADASAGVGLPVQRWLRVGLLVLLAAWAAGSLARFPVLHGPLAGPELPRSLRLLAVVAVALYAYAALQYGRLYGARRRPLPLAVAVAWVLLAEAMIAVVFARNWHASWWEWHVLMAAAFGTIFLAARVEYRRTGSVAEALSGLYHDRTLALVDQQTSEALAGFAHAVGDDERLDSLRHRLRAAGLTEDRIGALERSAVELRRVSSLLEGYVGTAVAERLAADPDLGGLGGQEREVTVLFADLVGFTTYSESRPPEAGMDLVNAYWAAVVPTIVDTYGGVVERFAGDGIVVIFNALDDQPDHALQAVRCARFIQRTIAAIAADHPDWPLFRIGINTGPAVIGHVGAAQRRNLTVIGDTANTAARFESLARPGRILIGPSTYDRVREQVPATSVGLQALKGKAAPVEVYEVAD